MSYFHPPTSKSLESTVGARAALILPLALCSQFQCVLEPTGALQYVVISRVAEALTAHLHITKSVRVVHISLTLPLRGGKFIQNIILVTNPSSISVLFEAELRPAAP